MTHICADCGCSYAPDLPRCPQCQSVEWRPSYEEPEQEPATLATTPAEPADPGAGAEQKPAKAAKSKPEQKWPGDGDG